MEVLLKPISRSEKIVNIMKYSVERFLETSQRITLCKVKILLQEMLFSKKIITVRKSLKKIELKDSIKITFTFLSEISYTVH